jgi:chromosome segregation ATPase
MRDASARVDEKSSFLRDCPEPEDAAALVLGCYDGRIFVLRVTDPDLVGVMTVTAAHEMLHAAFEEMPADERREVVRRLEAHLERRGDPKIEELLALYEELEPGARGNELHSLVGTQVRDLPRALERHYAKLFSDRDELVDAFEDYQAVFDFLQANADRLSGELDAMRTQLDTLQAEGDAAGVEADRLYDEIQRLRAQGRINESNGLVGAQNAAADRANSLGAEYNALVGQYNAKVTELNELALYTSRKYDEISPVPIDPPT